MSYQLWKGTSAEPDSAADDGNESLKQPAAPGPELHAAPNKPQEKKKQHRGLALAPPISPTDRLSVQQDDNFEAPIGHARLQPALEEDKDARLDEVEAPQVHQKKRHGLAVAPAIAPPARQLSISEHSSAENSAPSIVTFSGVPGAFRAGGGSDDVDTVATRSVQPESSSETNQDLPVLTAERVTEPEIAEIVPPWWSLRKKRFAVLGVVALIVVAAISIAVPLSVSTQSSSLSNSLSSTQWRQIGNEIVGGSPGDHAGSAVALSSDGTILAVGSPLADSTGINAGQVAVYEVVGDMWTQLGQNLTAVRAGDWFGRSVALSADGRTLAVGASENDDGGTDAGAVRVYRYDGARWMQLGDTILGESADDRSGVSVSLADNGNRVAVGSIFADGPGGTEAAGHVRVFELDVQTWIQVGSTIEGVGGGDQSGWSISLSSDGNVIAIGAWGNDDWDLDAGHVRVFRFLEGQDWTKVGSTIEGEVRGDQSGISVSLSSSGEVVAIGAWLNDGNGTDSGHVRVFQLADDWTQIGNDVDGIGPGDGAGIAVSLSGEGTVVAIGAPYNDGNNANNTTDSGLVRVYSLDGSEWIPMGDGIVGKAGDELGFSVALSFDGSVVAVGATLSDANGDNSGHVRVFRLDQG